MKCAYCVLLVTLLCSCTVHRESGEAADSDRLPDSLPFLDRANPLVKRTFDVMEERARDRELREVMRAEGLRVCEEGESGPPWKEDCNTCWCDRGHRACTKAYCHHHPGARPQLERVEREFAKRRHELREMHRARGVRICEEGESGPPWQEGCNTCWCEQGVRSCTKDCAPPPPPISAVPRPTQPPEPDNPNAR